MKKNVLITSFDMEIGGVERSLISMLENFNYKDNDVDLMLYSHTGDFFKLLPKEPKLLEEVGKYSTFRKSISQTIKEGYVFLFLTRLLSRINSPFIARKNNLKESAYVQMQTIGKYAVPFLPKIKKEYDVAISYLWPHYVVAEKVKAKTKIAWIHTDYSKLETDINLDLKMWDKFNYIIAVSEDCKLAFLKKYPSLYKKVKVIENITSPDFIRKMAKEDTKEDIEKKNFNIVSVARFSYAKGIDNAVKSLKILHNKGLTNIKWYVVGYGGDEDLIKSLIKENNLEDSFILLGKKTNPYPYINKADLYVQPSRYEGKAVTVTEAQILGKPVLITNYTTAKSQIKSGENGLITELSIEGIANGIESLYKDEKLRNILANNCKNSDFGNSEELEKLYKLFK